MAIFELIMVYTVNMACPAGTLDSEPICMIHVLLAAKIRKKTSIEVAPRKTNSRQILWLFIQAVARPVGTRKWYSDACSSSWWLLFDIWENRHRNRKLKFGYRSLLSTMRKMADRSADGYVCRLKEKLYEAHNATGNWNVHVLCFHLTLVR